MKMKVLFALGLCFAITFPLLAQDKEIKEVDSVYITPFSGSKIILVGKNMEKLLKENNLEVLKNKFIQDYQESTKDKDFPATAKNIIYLAGQDGRRRLKAVPDETAPLKIQEEIESFKSNLPAFHYIIYDLTKNYEYHIYVKGPEDLDSLENINLLNVIKDAKSAQPLRPKSFSSINIVSENNSYIYQLRNRKKFDMLSLSGSINGIIVNNRFSPGAALNLDLTFSNRYGRSTYKAGYEFGINFFGESQGDSTLALYNINHHHFHFMKNFSRTKKEYWLGLSTGRFSGFAEPDQSKNTNLYKARQYGIISQFDNWGVEGNLIFGRNDKVTAGITLRYYF